MHGGVSPFLTPDLAAVASSATNPPDSHALAQRKTAKLQGIWSTSEGEKRLCQGCVGQTAAIARNLSHVQPLPKTASAIVAPPTAAAEGEEREATSAFKACAECVNPLVSAGLGHGEQGSKREAERRWRERR